MTLKHLAALGQPQREIARILGVTEGAVRYHLRRLSAGATDGRTQQPFLAADSAEAIAHYVASGSDGPVNLAALHAWLVAESGYRDSLRSVQRYFRAHFPRPRLRARRRVETPPGAQAQVDSSEWPRVMIAGRVHYSYLFYMGLSYSRFSARVWSIRKGQLAWHLVHNKSFRRLEGGPATARVDNERTAVSRGAGPWGEINFRYRSHARQLWFHIDACPPRCPEYKGKIERGNRDDRRWREFTRRHWDSFEQLRAWTDAQGLAEVERRLCPATGATVIEVWQWEKPFLQPVPLLPEPFDVVVTRPVSLDCLVAFESRPFSVPFAWAGQRVEVRGCAHVVQVYAGGEIIAQHPRHDREGLVIDQRCYEGESTDRVTSPTPLGRMGRRLQEIAAMAPQQRPLDLYAALAEAAR